MAPLGPYRNRGFCHGLLVKWLYYSPPLTNFISVTYDGVEIYKYFVTTGDVVVVRL